MEETKQENEKTVKVNKTIKKKKAKKVKSPKPSIAFRVKTLTSMAWMTYRQLEERITENKFVIRDMETKKAEQMLRQYALKDQKKKDEETFDMLAPAVKFMEAHPQFVRLHYGAGMLSQLMEMEHRNAPAASMDGYEDINSEKYQSIFRELPAIVRKYTPSVKFIVQLDFDKESRNTLFVCRNQDWKMEAELRYNGKKSSWKEPESQKK